eukprot:6757744-Prymnesium_polylepis.1
MGIGDEHGVAIERLKRRTSTLVPMGGAGAEERELQVMIRDLRELENTHAPPVVRADERVEVEQEAASALHEDERMDESSWSPAPHLIAVDPGSLGEMSLVVGKHLLMLSNNLLATSSGSPVTVSPRGVLLRPDGTSKHFYFEILILRASESASGGVCCGFANEMFNASNDASGVGGDQYSWGISRSGVMHNGKVQISSAARDWCDGDVIGCKVDLKRKKASFTRNGGEELASIS